MRYLLILTLTLLSASTAMADPPLSTDLLEGESFYCELEDTGGGFVGVGSFVFAPLTVDGLLAAVLDITGPAGNVVSTWECGSDPLNPGKGIQCFGVGPANFPFTATAAGKLKRRRANLPHEQERPLTLVLGTVGFEVLPGPTGIARCIQLL